MYTSIFENLPDIISRSSETPLGVMSLAMIIISFVAIVFFRNETKRWVKLLVFLILFLGLGFLALSVQKTITNNPELISKSQPSSDPHFKVSVGADKVARRDFIQGVDEDSLQWVIRYNGKQVLAVNAKGRTEYEYFGTNPGNYSVHLEKFVDGQYRVVSNTATYSLP